VVNQQFELARQILATGLVPIIDLRLDNHSPEKRAAEATLKAVILEGLASFGEGPYIMLKLMLPEVDDFHGELVSQASVLRVVALSGGYSRGEANARLVRNHGIIASFSRALIEGLLVDQTDEEFGAILDKSIASIFEASMT
jgi:fructose-bisphosphate aldolase class I